MNFFFIISSFVGKLSLMMRLMVHRVGSRTSKSNSAKNIIIQYKLEFFLHYVIFLFLYATHKTKSKDHLNFLKKHPKLECSQSHIFFSILLFSDTNVFFEIFDCLAF